MELLFTAKVILNRDDLGIVSLMVESYGVRTFRPDLLVIEYDYKPGRDTEWVTAGVRIRGPQMLKDGREGRNRCTFEGSGPRQPALPDWAEELVTKCRPTVLPPVLPS